MSVKVIRQFVGGHLAGLNAVFGGPVDVVGLALASLSSLSLGGLAALVVLGNLFQLVGEGADLAAGVWKAAVWRRAGVEQVDLRLNLPVDRSRGGHRGLRCRFQLLIVGSGVEGLLLRLALLDLFLQISRNRPRGIGPDSRARGASPKNSLYSDQATVNSNTKIEIRPAGSSACWLWDRLAAGCQASRSSLSMVDVKLKC